MGSSLEHKFPHGESKLAPDFLAFVPQLNPKSLIHSRSNQVDEPNSEFALGKHQSDRTNAFWEEENLEIALFQSERDTEIAMGS